MLESRPGRDYYRAMRQGIEGRLAQIAGWFLSRATFGALPPFSAAAALVERDGRILTIERNDGLGFNLPGGFLRWQERVEDGLLREVFEETGFHVAIDRMVGVYSGPAPNQRLSSVALVYAASIIGGRQRDSFEGRVLWLQPSELVGRMAFGNEQMLLDYLAADRFDQVRASSG
ncbi:MAG: NUDIX hydrolase [Dehalococcoidia bacterium]